MFERYSGLSASAMLAIAGIIYFFLGAFTGNPSALILLGFTGLLFLLSLICAVYGVCQILTRNDPKNSKFISV